MDLLEMQHTVDFLETKSLTTMIHLVDAFADLLIDPGRTKRLVYPPIYSQNSVILR